MKTKIVKAEVKTDYRVYLEFSDGVCGDVDFSEYVGKGVFKKWEDYKNFLSCTIDEWGALVWEGDLDFCPDALYMKITQLKPEEYFSIGNNQYA